MWIAALAWLGNARILEMLEARTFMFTTSGTPSPLCLRSAVCGHAKIARENHCGYADYMHGTYSTLI